MEKCTTNHGQAVEGCTNGDRAWVVTTEMIQAYRAVRGAAGVGPDDVIRRAIDAIDANKPDGERCSTLDLASNIRRAPDNDNELVTAGYNLLPPSNMAHLSAIPPRSPSPIEEYSETPVIGVASATPVAKAGSAVSVVHDCLAPTADLGSGQAREATMSFSKAKLLGNTFDEFIHDFATAEDGGAMTSEELREAVPDYDDNGFITDDPDDPYPSGRISPCTFAFFADGCKRWDTHDPNAPVTAEVPANGPYKVADEDKDRGNRGKNNPNGHGGVEIQMDKETGSIMSGKYTVSPKPSLLLTAPGNSRYRHLEGDIDVTLFDRMNSNGHAARALADMRSDPVSVMCNVAPADEDETYTDAEVRAALFDKKFSGALWKGIYPSDVEPHLKLWSDAIAENRKQQGEAHAWIRHVQVSLDAVEQQRKDVLDMVHSNPEFVAQRDRAARIREHVANTVRGVKQEYHRSHAEWQRTVAQGEALFARLEAKKQELAKICNDWGFGYPAEVYQKFGRLEEFANRD